MYIMKVFGDIKFNYLMVQVLPNPFGGWFSYNGKWATREPMADHAFLVWDLGGLQTLSSITKGVVFAMRIPTANVVVSSILLAQGVMTLLSSGVWHFNSGEGLE